LLFAGSLGLVFLSDRTALLLIVGVFIIRQIGIGLLLMPTVTWGMSRLSKMQYSDGTALLSSLRTIAGALGAAAFVSIMTIVAGSTAAAEMFRGVSVAFLLMAVMAGALVVMALVAIKDS